MSFRPSLLFTGLLLISICVQAEEKEEPSPPSLELLEFLGQWETDNGERIDPVELEKSLLEQLGWMETGETNE